MSGRTVLPWRFYRSLQQTGPISAQKDINGDNNRASGFIIDSFRFHRIGICLSFIYVLEKTTHTSKKI